MRVIVDLVVNHTSDRHPWFRSARASRTSPYRDFYVWRADPPPDTANQVVFPDQEDSLWQYDERTEEWYLHRFYRTQPDLNITNPTVRDEIVKAMGFWLELGISGFRVDAVPFVLETTGVDAQELARFHDPHAYLRTLRSFVGRRTGDGILLGEVNLPHKDQKTFFGGAEGDELTMQFDFIGMQNLYLSLARQDGRPLARALRKRPAISRDSQWATFVRNHDELTLDKLSDSERAEVFAAFGPEPEMQLYGRGLRRRLPSMLEGDPRRIRMAYSLMFSLPGTPVLFYGEEIGMGENLAIEGRMSVRAPMQWSDEPNGGFSTTEDPKALCRPVAEGEFGPERVNAAAQRRDPHSLLNWFERLIRRRRECPELGWGRYTALAPREPEVLAHRCDWDESTIVAVHNLAGHDVRTTLPFEGEGTLVDLLGTEDLEAPFTLGLEAYGYRWYRLRRPGQRIAP
jgi:trehalose synthase